MCEQLPAETEKERICTKEAVFTREQFEDLEVKEKDNIREEFHGVLETLGVTKCIDDEQLNQQSSDNLDFDSYKTEVSDIIQPVGEIKNELEEDNWNTVSTSESIEVQSSQPPCNNLSEPTATPCANIANKVDTSSSVTDIVLSSPADTVDSTTTIYTSTSPLITSTLTTTAASSNTCDSSESNSEQFFSPPESITLESDSDLFSDTFDKIDKIEQEVHRLVSQFDSAEEDSGVEEEKHLLIAEEIHRESPPSTLESFEDNHLEEKALASMEAAPIMYTVHKNTNDSGQSQYIVKVSSDAAVEESDTVSHRLNDFTELWSELQMILSESSPVRTLNKLNISESSSIPNPGDENSGTKPCSRVGDLTGLETFLNQVASDPVLQSEPCFLHFVGCSLPLNNGNVGGTGHGSSNEMNMREDPQLQNGEKRF